MRRVRSWGAKALVAKPTLPKLALLAPMLHDADPDLRRYVCDSLVELSKDASLHEAVMNHGRQVLGLGRMAGQEQAILLLVTLDDKSIADQLLGLLAATRPRSSRDGRLGSLPVAGAGDGRLPSWKYTRRPRRVFWPEAYNGTGCMPSSVTWRRHWAA